MDINEVLIMKKVLKCMLASVLSAFIVAAAVFPAFALSAKTGDTVEVKVSIEGEDSMGSTTIQITYDKDKLDFLSDDTLDGTGLSNPNEPGILLWAAMFDANGVDYTKKTDVYSVVFIAKQDIDSLENIIQFEVKDAYRIGASGIEPADKSKLSCSIALEGAGGSTESQAVSEQETTSSESVSSVSSAASSKTSSVNSVNAASSSKVSSNTSSAVSSRADTQSKPSTASFAESSEASSKSKEKSSETDLSSKSDTDTSKKLDTEADTEEDIEETAIAIKDSEFESVPPIKTDNDSVSSAADSRGAFPKAAIIGIAICLAAAIAGSVLLISKKKT